MRQSSFAFNALGEFGVLGRRGCGEVRQNSSCRINPQHLHELGDLAQMPQRIARRLIVASQEVHVENILPRPPAPQGSWEWWFRDRAGVSFAGLTIMIRARKFHSFLL